MTASSTSSWSLAEYKHFIVTCFTIIFLFVSYIIYTTFLPTRTLRVVFLDVGQGDSIYIESPTHTKVIIDGGAHLDSDAKLSKYISFFDKQIDLIIPTHADSDHITGLVEDFMRYDVRDTTSIHASSTSNIFAAYEKDKEGHEYRGLLGDTIDIGGGAFLTVVLPKEGETFSKDETNDSSTVMLLTYEGYTFLLTGDLPETREHALLASGLIPHDITVLKLGHHGSKYSTGEELLAYTHPHYAIISAGKDNKYGHPNKETIDRVSAIGSEVISTIESGNIEFDIENEGIRIKVEK